MAFVGYVWGSVEGLFPEPLWEKCSMIALSALRDFNDVGVRMQVLFFCDRISGKLTDPHIFCLAKDHQVSIPQVF